MCINGKIILTTPIIPIWNYTIYRFEMFIIRNCPLLIRVQTFVSILVIMSDKYKKKLKKKLFFFLWHTSSPSKFLMNSLDWFLFNTHILFNFLQLEKGNWRQFVSVFVKKRWSIVIGMIDCYDCYFFLRLSLPQGWTESESRVQSTIE